MTDAASGSCWRRQHRSWEVRDRSTASQGARCRPAPKARHLWPSAKCGRSGSIHVGHTAAARLLMRGADVSAVRVFLSADDQSPSAKSSLIVVPKVRISRCCYAAVLTLRWRRPESTGSRSGTCSKAVSSSCSRTRSTSGSAGSQDRRERRYMYCRHARARSNSWQLRPPTRIQGLRDLTRTRKQIVGEMSQHTLRIQKALEDANLKVAASWRVSSARADVPGNNRVLADVEACAPGKTSIISSISRAGRSPRRRSLLAGC